jgi:hypothetical protein
VDSKAVAALLLGMVLGCAHRSVDVDLGDVHPGVFAMVPSWLSDNASPVVTEVNLDAAATNRNQFGEIARDGGWTRVDADDGRGYMRYCIVESRPPRYRILYQENGGGTLTTSDLIEIEVDTCAVEVDGAATAVRVMRVLSIERMAHGRPLQPRSDERADEGARVETSAQEGIVVTDLGDGRVITVEGDDHVTIPGESESRFGVNGYSYRKSVEFMAEFQERVRARDLEAVADAVAFPLLVYGATPLVVRDRKALLRQFDRVFDSETARAILAADLRRVSCCCRGIMIGHGVVWAVTGDDGRYAVRTINQPRGTRADASIDLRRGAARRLPGHPGRRSAGGPEQGTRSGHPCEWKR